MKIADFDYLGINLRIKIMKQRNKKIKNVVYVATYAPPFFYLKRRFTKPEICGLTFTTASSILNISIFHFF